MIFGKHINRYYLKYLHWLLLGVFSLFVVDLFQLKIPELYRMVINGIENGYVTGKAYLGIFPEDIEEHVIRYYGIPKGAYVAGVTPGTCSDKAGIETGDIITAIDGSETRSVEELKAVGIEVSASKPIYLDIPMRTDSEVNKNTKQAMKQSIEDATGGCIKCNLVEYETRDDYLAATYRFEVGKDANYDLNDGSGWGPDYGDPSTYLGTMLPNYAGYMTKSLGIF